MKIAINSSMFARFEKFIYTETHGSGLNYDYEWRLTRSGIRLDTYFHPMNDAGWHLPAVKVTIWFYFDETFKVRCANPKPGCYGLKDYLEDVFARVYGAWLQQEQNMLADGK